MGMSNGEGSDVRPHNSRDQAVEYLNTHDNAKRRLTGIPGHMISVQEKARVQNTMVCL